MFFQIVILPYFFKIEFLHVPMICDFRALGKCEGLYVFWRFNIVIILLDCVNYEENTLPTI